MIRVHCRTNLDDIREKWPDELPERPMVGDLIRSEKQYKDLRGAIIGVVELEVVRCTWKFDSLVRMQQEWILEVELHLPQYRFSSISAFQKWYQHIRSGGQTV